MTSSVRSGLSLILGASLVSAYHHSTFKVNCDDLCIALGNHAAGGCAESIRSDSESGDVACASLTDGKTCKVLQEIHSKSGCAKPESKDDHVGTRAFFLHISTDLKMQVQVAENGKTSKKWIAAFTNDAPTSAFVADIFRSLRPASLELPMQMKKDPTTGKPLLDGEKCKELIRTSKLTFGQHVWKDVRANVWKQGPNVVEELGEEKDDSERKIATVCKAILKYLGGVPEFNTQYVNGVPGLASWWDHITLSNVFGANTKSHVRVLLTSELFQYLQIKDEEKFRDLHEKFPPSFGREREVDVEEKTQHFLMSYKGRFPGVRHSGVMRCSVVKNSDGGQKYHSCEEYNFPQGATMSNTFKIGAVQRNMVGFFRDAYSYHKTIKIGSPTTKKISDMVLCGGKMGFECQKTVLEAYMSTEDSFAKDQLARVETEQKTGKIGNGLKTVTPGNEKEFAKFHAYNLITRNCNTYARYTMRLLLATQKRRGMDVDNDLKKVRKFYKSGGIIEQATWFQFSCTWYVVLFIPFLLLVAVGIWGSGCFSCDCSSWANGFVTAGFWIAFIWVFLYVLLAIILPSCTDLIGVSGLGHNSGRTAALGDQHMKMVKSTMPAHIEKVEASITKSVKKGEASTGEASSTTDSNIESDVEPYPQWLQVLGDDNADSDVEVGEDQENYQMLAGLLESDDEDWDVKAEGAGAVRVGHEQHEQEMENKQNSGSGRPLPGSPPSLNAEQIGGHWFFRAKPVA